ncbi:hypothetical protein BC829DRAFT_383755 [Chytridium lagenaria]|nr:hypothetical protein BC829DRAFT_383755 [Chytridium lagenaria]
MAGTAISEGSPMLPPPIDEPTTTITTRKRGRVAKGQSVGRSRQTSSNVSVEVKAEDGRDAEAGEEDGEEDDAEEEEEEDEEEEGWRWEKEKAEGDRWKGKEGSLVSSSGSYKRQRGMEDTLRRKRNTEAARRSRQKKNARVSPLDCSLSLSLFNLIVG